MDTNEIAAGILKQLEDMAIEHNRALLADFGHWQHLKIPIKKHKDRYKDTSWHSGNIPGYECELREWAIDQFFEWRKSRRC